MDYKHIEDILVRYWQCKTSLHEELELRSFFSTGKELPPHLEKHRDYFLYLHSQTEDVGLDEEFDKRVFARIEPPIVVKARKLTLIGRLTPLMKAAAIVAIVLGLGNVLQHSAFMNNGPDYNYDSYTDTYDSPEAAYDQVSTALKVLSEGINKSVNQVDSLQPEKAERLIKQ